MKKIYYIVCLILIISFISGCNKKEFNEKVQEYDVEKITSINSINLKIVKDDYEKITPILNALNFQQEKMEVSGKYTPLYVNYNNVLYAYAIYDNGIIKCTKEDKVFYTNNKNKAEEILNVLDQLNDKYTKESFYTIEYIDTYSEVNDAVLVDLKNGNSMIKINFKKDVKSFSVMSLKEDDEIGVEAEDMEKAIIIDKTFDYKEKISAPTTIVIKYQPMDYQEGISIRFENVYGYRYMITAKYNANSNKVEFDTKIVG